MSETVRYSWSQPVCDACYEAMHPGRMPARLREWAPETCCKCGAETDSGIYVRVDPSTVPHPTNEKSS